MIAWDLETELIDRAYMAPAPVSASWCGDGEDEYEMPSLCLVGKDFWNRLEGWLRDSVRLLGANTAYDFGVAMEHGPRELAELIFAKYERGEIWDVAVDQKIIDFATMGYKRKSYALDAVAVYNKLEHGNKDASWRKRFASLRNVPVENWPAGARSYVLDDAALPIGITHAHLRREADCITKTGQPLFTHLAGEEAYKAFALHLISCWGVRTDYKRSHEFLERVKARLLKGRGMLQEAGLVRACGKRDTKAAAAAMTAACKELGLAIPRTDKGGVCLDKEACEASGSDLLVAYSEYSTAQTLLARAEDLTRGTHLPLQTRFDTLLRTSRTSTSKPDLPLIGAQMQNFPRELGARECLEPRPGWVFIGGDLPTAELRSLSQTNIELFGFSDMGDKINAGIDLHTWFGAQVLGVPYETMVERIIAEEIAAVAARQNAKPCNFGFPGGMGIPNFRAYAWAQYKVRLSAEAATRLQEIWLASFREMPLYFNRASEMIRRGGREFKNEDGDRYKAVLMRHLRTGRWRARVPYCTLCNTQFQERTATAAGRCVAEVARRMYTVKSSALYGCRTIMFTHDEIVGEAPEEQAPEAAVELGEVMRDRFNTLHELVPVKDVAPFVARVYSKKTKAVHGPDGRLIPWVPKIAA